MPHNVFLVGCGKSKLPQTAKVRDLYTGTLFRRSLRLASLMAEQEGGDVFVLSAKHGLLNLGERIAPYELALSSLPKRARMQWGERVVRQICDAYLIGHAADLRLLSFSILAGAAYADAITAALAIQTPFASEPVVSEPMRGMGIGKRLASLGRDIARLESAAT